MIGLLFSASLDVLSMVQLLLKLTMALAILLAGHWLFRNRLAASRHGFLVLALASIPLVAAVHFLLPVINVETLASEFFSAPAANYELAVAREAITDIRVETAPEIVAIEPLASQAFYPVSSRQMTSTTWPLKNILWAIWMAGVAILFVRYAAAWAIGFRQVRQCELLDTARIDNIRVRELAEGLNTSGQEILVHGCRGRMPMCFGVLKPTIFVSREFHQWESDKQESVLLHEAAHAHRHDGLTNFIAQLECALLWFHPLVWFLARLIRSESEMACDEWAISRGVDKVNYASSLFEVTVQTKKQNSISIASASMADCSPLERRMHSILEFTHRPGERNRYANAVSSSCLLIAVGVLATIRLTAATPVGQIETAIPDQTLKIEHTVTTSDGKTIRGTLDGDLELTTAYGSAKLRLTDLRLLELVKEDQFEALVSDGSTIRGKLDTAEFRLLDSDDRLTTVAVGDVKKISTLGAGELKPGGVASGFMGNGITWRIRTPKEFEPTKKYPAIVFLHQRKGNGSVPIKQFATAWPELAETHFLIGINGEQRHESDPDSFGYTYVDFVGRSKYKGFPGSDRQSPALVAETLQQLRARMAIGKTWVIGVGDGAFLGISMMMNYPELVDGVASINGGLLVQCAPEAYEDKPLIEQQKRIPLWLLHSKDRDDYPLKYTQSINKALTEGGFDKLRFTQTEGKTLADLPLDDVLAWLGNSANH